MASKTIKTICMKIEAIKYYTKAHPLYRDGLKFRFLINGLLYLRSDGETIFISRDKFFSWIDKGYISNNQDAKPDINRIMHIVASELDLNIDALQARVRKRELVRGRQIVHFLAEKYTDESLSAIGFEVGGLSHCTVLHSIKTVKGFVDIYPDWERKINLLEKAIA